MLSCLLVLFLSASGPCGRRSSNFIRSSVYFSLFFFDGLCWMEGCKTTKGIKVGKTPGEG
jgi:hypothetical protein